MNWFLENPFISFLLICAIWYGISRINWSFTSADNDNSSFKITIGSAVAEDNEEEEVIEGQSKATTQALYRAQYLRGPVVSHEKDNFGVEIEYANGTKYSKDQFGEEIEYPDGSTYVKDNFGETFTLGDISKKKKKKLAQALEGTTVVPTPVVIRKQNIVMSDIVMSNDNGKRTLVIGGKDYSHLIPAGTKSLSINSNHVIADGKVIPLTEAEPEVIFDQTMITNEATRRLYDKAVEEEARLTEQRLQNGA